MNRIACCHFSLPFYDQIIAQHGQVEDIVSNNQRLFQEMNRLGDQAGLKAVAGKDNNSLSISNNTLNGELCLEEDRK